MDTQSYQPQVERRRLESPDSVRPRTKKVRARTPEAKAHVLRLAERLGSVSRACQIMGYSRDSFYRFKRLYETGGVAALEGPCRNKPLLKNRVLPEIERRVVELSCSSPGMGRTRVAAVLKEEGLVISPSGVRCVWLRHGLETMAQRESRAQRETQTQRETQAQRETYSGAASALEQS